MINETDVKKIAKLAHLYVSDSEASVLTGELNAILGYVEQLNKIDVSSVSPLSHVHGAVNVLRPDEVEPSMDNAKALTNAPDKSGRFIRVPLVIGQGE